MPKYRIVFGDELDHEKKIRIFNNPDKYGIGVLAGLAAALNMGALSDNAERAIETAFISTEEFEGCKDRFGFWRDVTHLVKEIE